MSLRKVPRPSFSSINILRRIFKRLMSEKPVEISKNQEKNEAKRLAKLAKFNAKKLKEQEQKPSSQKKKEKVQKVAAVVPEFVNSTPKGDKKDVSGPIPPFQPKMVEAAWYDWWESQGFFKPQLTKNGKTKEEGVFVVPIPPPNVTGTLHLGHALTDSIQDVMVRWYLG
jgi:valyl-tRNA synthetase